MSSKIFKKMTTFENCMNEREKAILRRNHCLIVSTLDTQVIRKYLFEKGIVGDPLYLEDDGVTTRRAEKFMKLAVKKCSFKTFLNLLSENGYSFVADHLMEDFNDLASKNNYIPYDRKEPIFDVQWRARTNCFRHKLKRLAHGGEIKQFDKEKNHIEKKWNSLQFPFDFTDESREVADMYFMAKDAELERLRVNNDKNFGKSEIICKEILQVSAYTSSTAIPIGMQLARLASASVVAGRATVTQALRYIQDAKQKLSTIPACRETGVVLYIEYNMYTLLYEAQPLHSTREYILELGEKVIQHFENDVADETMGSDFRRMVLLKLCHMLLNIGLFHNFLNENILTEENKQGAEEILREIEKPEYWSRMEERWLMFYYTAQSRLCKLKKLQGRALEYMLKSETCAKNCRCNKELINIRKEVKEMKKANEFSISIHDVCSELCSLSTVPVIDFPTGA